MIQLLRINQKKFKCAHITLQNGERGDLANLTKDLH